MKIQVITVNTKKYKRGIKENSFFKHIFIIVARQMNKLNKKVMRPISSGGLTF